MQKKIVAIIPARYGSTRLEGKPLINICGKPMIQRVYEQTKKAVQNVVVATDDTRIFEAVKKFGGEVIMTSEKHKTGTNRCLEAYQVLSKKDTFDIVLNIQGDEPLLEPNQIKELISCFEDTETTMASLATPTKDKAELKSGVFVVMDKQKFALYFSRAIIPFNRDENKENWNAKHTYYKHVGMYGFTPKALKEFSELSESSLEKLEKLEQLRWLENGNKIKIAHTKYNSVAVDTLEDINKVVKIISNKV